MVGTSGESVISRVVRIIEAFDRELGGLTLSTLAERINVPISSTHRLVVELSELGVLERDDDRRIRIGTRLWEITSRSSRILELREIALPHMELLRSQVRQHVNLAVLDQGSVLFVERLSVGDPVAEDRQAERWPIHASSVGLVLLAYSDPGFQEEVLGRPLAKLTDETITDPMIIRRQLPDIRQRRLVTAPSAGIPEVTGMATPIDGPDGRVIAAMSIVYPGNQVREQSAVHALHRTSRMISEALRKGAFGT